MGIYRWEKAEEKDFTGRKAKGSSEKPSRRDYQPLSIKTSAPSLPPYQRLTPILKRKAPRFRILKKCMTRLEALRLIRNGPTHPAMMHDRRERAQNGVSLLGEAHVRKESFSRLSPLCWTFSILPYFGMHGKAFSGRPGHVPWREVSSHLIALIVGISKKYALSLIHI